MKILTSGLITEITGRLNGTVFQQGRFGLIGRSWVKPRVRNLDFITYSKASFYNASKKWSSFTCSVKTEWENNASAGAYGFYESTGNPLSGFHAYMKVCKHIDEVNYFNPSAFLCYPDSPPALGSATILQPYTIYSVNSDNNFYLDFSPGQGKQTADYLFLFCSKRYPCSPPPAVLTKQLLNVIDYSESTTNSFANTRYLMKSPPPPAEGTCQTKAYIFNSDICQFSNTETAICQITNS